MDTKQIEEVEKPLRQGEKKRKSYGLNLLAVEVTIQTFLMCQSTTIGSQGDARLGSRADEGLYNKAALFIKDICHLLTLPIYPLLHPVDHGFYLLSRSNDSLKLAVSNQNLLLLDLVGRQYGFNDRQRHDAWPSTACGIYKEISRCCLLPVLAFWSETTALIQERGR